ncbi:MAG: hypothetical protein AAGE84_00915 [Cyanobacteria bacterium P01_G01_bin.39]
MSNLQIADLALEIGLTESEANYIIGGRRSFWEPKRSEYNTFKDINQFQTLSSVTQGNQGVGNDKGSQNNSSVIDIFIIN